MSNQIAVALSGASSFTGIWIAKALSESGFKVHALLSTSENTYIGLRRERVQFLKNWATLHYDVAAENGALTQWVNSHAPALFIFHHHHMENFRSGRYDRGKAIAVGLTPLPALIGALGERRCQGVIFSGTYFEPGEGGRALTESFTPYALSKNEIWKYLQIEAAKQNLPLSKIVIPNPVGPYENEDRIIPTLIKKARLRETMPLNAPYSVGDSIPVENLASVYVEAARNLLRQTSKIYRPSGWVGTVYDFAKEVNSGLIKKHLKIEPVRLELPITQDPHPPQIFNPEAERLAFSWNDFWRNYVEITKLKG